MSKEQMAILERIRQGAAVLAAAQAEFAGKCKADAETLQKAQAELMEQLSALNTQKTALDSEIKSIKAEIKLFKGVRIGNGGHREEHPNGTTWERDYKGKHFRVVATSQWYECDKIIYRSLSEVACEITGQSRSGNDFFGNAVAIKL